MLPMFIVVGGVCEYENTNAFSHPYYRGSYISAHEFIIRPGEKDKASHLTNRLPQRV